MSSNNPFLQFFTLLPVSISSHQILFLSLEIIIYGYILLHWLLWEPGRERSGFSNPFTARLPPALICAAFCCSNPHGLCMCGPRSGLTLSWEALNGSPGQWTQSEVTRHTRQRVKLFGS